MVCYRSDRDNWFFRKSLIIALKKSYAGAKIIYIWPQTSSHNYGIKFKLKIEILVRVKGLLCYRSFVKPEKIRFLLCLMTKKNVITNLTPERLELPTVRSGVEYATNCAKESGWNRSNLIITWIGIILFNKIQIDYSIVHRV